MLDERFPMYQVDLAYCYMLKMKGFKIHYTASAAIVHYGSQSVNQRALAGIRLQHQGFIDFSDHYDYFSSNLFDKVLDQAGGQATVLAQTGGISSKQRQASD